MASYEDVKLDKVESAIQSNITTVLETVSDPRGRVTGGKFVYQADPRTKAADFGSYPIMYIEHYGSTDESQNVGGNLFNVTAEAEIHVVAEDDSAQQKQWHDQISDEVTFMFRAGERHQLSEQGIGQPEIQRSQRFTGIDKNDQPVIRREVEVQMDMQLDLDKVT